MTTDQGKQKCGTCSGEYTVTAAGGMRHHFTDSLEFQAGPDSRKCAGVGQPPAGVGEDTDESLLGHICRVCHHPVALTDNGRARTHLDLSGVRCDGGSDWPLRVDKQGNRTDTAPSEADQLKAVETDDVAVHCFFDCGHVERGADPQAVHEAMEQHYSAGHVGQAQEAVDRLNGRTEAEQFADAPSALVQQGLKRETAGTGTVLDALSPEQREALTRDPRTDEQKARDARMSELTREAAKVLEQRTPEQKAETAARMDRTASAALGLPVDPALNHEYTDPSGTKWVHPGPEESCETPDCELLRSNDPHAYEAAVAIATDEAERAEIDRQHAEILSDVRRRACPDGVYCQKCDTETHLCPGCGENVPHGTVTCDDCTARVAAEDAERQAKCTHPDGFRAPLMIGGHEVSACGHCNAVQWFTGPSRALPIGETDDGRPCDHSDQPFGIDGGKLVCVACGTPCTHPGGFTENDPVEDDGEGLIFTCAICGGVDDGQPANDWRTPADLLAKMPKSIQAADAMRLDCATCGHPVTPLADRFETDGSVKAVVWMCRPTVESDFSGACRGHECTPDIRVRVGELEHGDLFSRRGTAMEVTEAGGGVITAIVVDNGPHAGRLGKLKNPDEIVERLPRVKPTTTAGLESAPAVLPNSNPVTSSAPTETAPTKGRAAVPEARTTKESSVTTDQSKAAADFLAGAGGTHGEAETKRDRFGRYLLPHPDTGKEQAWTRATTFAKSISDTYALGQWQLRMCLVGATKRPDVVARAHGKHVRADKNLLDELTADLKDAAGDKVAANLGTAMHSFTEMVDKAWHTPAGPRSVLDEVPEAHRDDVETYIKMLESTGLEPVPGLVEFTTAVKQYGVAGTSDNCYKVTRPLTVETGRGPVTLNPGEYTIGDKKTGRNLDYGWGEIAIQLGTYARGLVTCGVYDRAAGTWDPKPLGDAVIRTDVGIVVHLPVEKTDKQPAVYGIDLESGWNAAVLCERVRAWRKTRKLAAPVVVSETEVFAASRPKAAVEQPVVSRTTVRPPTLRDEALAVTTKAGASAVWRKAKLAGMPEAETDALVTLMRKRLAGLEEIGG